MESSSSSPAAAASGLRAEFSWLGGVRARLPDGLFRAFSAPLDTVFGEWEARGEVNGAVTTGAEEEGEERIWWPRHALLAWETPLIVLPCLRLQLKTALLARVAELCTTSTAPSARRFTPVVLTQTSFLAALAKHTKRSDQSDAATTAATTSINVAVEDAWQVLLDASDSSLPKPDFPDIANGVSDGIVLLVDGWSGDLTPLRVFLARYAVHLAPCSERYAAEHKAGIGTEESSSDTPWPRFLGGARNDNWAALAGSGAAGGDLRRANVLPVARLLLACDPYTFQSQQLWRFFFPLLIRAPSPNEHALFVKSTLGTDCPSARAAADPWVAFLCGAAATIPPPVGANPGVPRLLLTSVSGALQHLSTRTGLGRPLLHAAGFLATCSLVCIGEYAEASSQFGGRPLTKEEFIELLAVYRSCGGGTGSGYATDEELFAAICTAVKPFLASSFPESSLRYGHLVIEQWLAGQFLTVEDSVTERVLRAVSEKWERFRMLHCVVGPLSNQTLPFVYSPRGTASGVWRGVLHFIGVNTGVYPLAYRLCAWGDNSNIAAYQWLLQLKSQACSPLPKKPLNQRAVPPLFEYHVHGDVGRQVFWILCRVQAEVSVSNPGQATEHGEENPFPHFVRAVIANPRHAYDLAYAVGDPVFGSALARLPDGLSIASHIGDLCLEAGVARPWAAACYARILSAMHVAGLLPSGFPSHQCRTLSSSKSTSKRLLASAYMREHIASTRAGLGSAAGTGEFFSSIEAVLMGCSDKSNFVRDECTATIKNAVLASCGTCLASEVNVEALLDAGICGLVTAMRDFAATSSGGSGGSGDSGSGSAVANAASVGLSSGPGGGLPHTQSAPAVLSVESLSAFSAAGSGTATGGASSAAALASLAKAVTSLVISGADLLLKGSPLAIVPFVLMRRLPVDVPTCSSLLYTLRRASALVHQDQQPEEPLFLWRAVSSALVADAALLKEKPSEDLLRAVNELACINAPLLRAAIVHLLNTSTDVAGVLLSSLRWAERPMRLEMVRAAVASRNGLDAISKLLEEKVSDADAEEVLVVGLCSTDGAASRTTQHLCRAAKALVGRRPQLVSLVLSTLKSDLTQRGWWRRVLPGEAAGTILSLLGSLERYATLASDLLGILADCNHKVPSDLLARLLLYHGGQADSASDFALHGVLLLMACVQRVCTLGLVTVTEGGFGSHQDDVISIVTAVSSPSPLTPAALVHGSQVTAVRLLTSLPGECASLVAKVCLAVICDKSKAPSASSSDEVAQQAASDFRFVNNGLAVSFCCNVVGWLRKDVSFAVPANWSLGGMIGFWRSASATASSVVAPLLSMTQTLVERRLVGASETLREVLPLAIASNAALCPQQREAALHVAQAAVVKLSESDREDATWIRTIFDELKARMESGIRAEEPGIVAAMKLLRFVAQVADADRAVPSTWKGVVANVRAHEPLLLGVLENVAAPASASGDKGSSSSALNTSATSSPLKSSSSDAAAAAGGGGGGGTWNISVVTEALGVVQHVISFEVKHAQVPLPVPETTMTNTEPGSPAFLSRYVLTMLSIVSDAALGTPVLRKAVMRVLRTVPRPMIIYGLRQLVCLSRHGNKGSKWLFGTKKQSSARDVLQNVSPIEVEAVTMAEFLTPVFRFFERSTHMTERLVLLELLALMTFPLGLDDIDPQCIQRTETFFCDFLKTGSSNASTELSTLVYRNAALLMPHVWAMLSASVKTRTLAGKWVNFLRKHYLPEQPTRLIPLVPQPPPHEVAAALSNFIVSCNAANRLESNVVFRMFGVIYEVVTRGWASCAPMGEQTMGSSVVGTLDARLSDCIAAVQTVALALASEAPQSTSEQKETTLLLALLLLGRAARIHSLTQPLPQGPQFFEPLRIVIDSMPFGLGRRAWVVLQSAVGTLLF